MTNTVRDVMSGDPVCLDPGTTLNEAAERMAERDIGAVLVVGDGNLRGIVTDRDIVVRALARHLDPERTPVDEILSGDVVTVELDDSIEQAVELMRERAIRRLPVTSGGEPVGILSLGDLAEQRDPTSALADISTAQPNR
jgi:CBS domain-containing protein